MKYVIYISEYKIFKNLHSLSLLKLSPNVCTFLMQTGIGGAETLLLRTPREILRRRTCFRIEFTRGRVSVKTVFHFQCLLVNV